MWKTNSNLIVKYLYIHININRKIQTNEVITQEKVKIIASKIPRICSEVLFNVHISHLQVKFIWNCQEGTNEKKINFIILTSSSLRSSWIVFSCFLMVILWELNSDTNLLLWKYNNTIQAFLSVETFYKTIFDC